MRRYEFQLDARGIELRLSMPPEDARVAIDERVLLFTLGAGALTALLTGVMPGWRGSLARPFDLLTGALHL